MIFDVENSLWKSNFHTLRRAGKASQDAYNPGKWLIFWAVLKNGVAEGVASNSHDTTVYQIITAISYSLLPALPNWLILEPVFCKKRQKSPNQEYIEDL